MRSKKTHPLIGRKISFKPAYMDVGAKTGTIIWVHPRGRFIVVEYECPPSLWREHPEKIHECLLYPTETGLIEG